MWRRWFLAGALGVGLLRGASPEVQQANGFYQRTEYKQAIAILESVPQPDADTLLLLGRAYFGAEAYAKATDTLEKAATLAPMRSDIYSWLGRAWAKRAETSLVWNQPRYASRARQAFEKSLELDRNNHDALDDLAEFYLQAPGFLGGGIEKAEELAKHIASLDAAWGQRIFARIKEQQKDFVGAEGHLRKAIELAPRQAAKLVDLGSFLARRGRAKESDEEFAKAMRLAPDDPEVLFARAQALVEQKRNPEEARRLLNQYLASNLTPDHPSRPEAQKLLQKISR
jgi:tetratricopeptide (TPR) repeat protein